MGVAIKLPLPAFGGRDSKAPAQRRPASSTARQRRREAPAKGATRQARAEAPAQPSYAWLNRLLVLLGMGAVAVALMQAWVYLAALPVERVAVTGDLEHTQGSELQELVYPVIGDGFLGTDQARLRDRLEALPWIYEASARRVWPNALEIHVVEQLPIARWGSDGFLNHHGEVFRPAARPAGKHLPLLAGPEGSAGELMGHYLRLVDLLAPLGLGLTQLDIDDRGEMVAVLAGGQTLAIGGRDFLERMQRFSAVYQAELQGQMASVERIDLRYQRGVAVAFRAPVDAAAAVVATTKNNNGNRG